MKKYKIFNTLVIIFILLALALELYSKGVITVQATTPGEIITRYYSYFSPMAYWDENPYPIQIAAYTSSMILFTLIKLFMKKPLLYNMFSVLSLICGTMAVLRSLQLVNSAYHITWTAYPIAIALSLACLFTVLAVKNPYEGGQR